MYENTHIYILLSAKRDSMASEEMHKNLEQRRQQTILSISKQFDTSAITGAKTYLLPSLWIDLSMHNHT